ncbi:MAG TPA: TIGR03560 family F420-dependent LLM class oxidoreductase [Candidatus Dormibacteraeota bacterium]
MTDSPRLGLKLSQNAPIDSYRRVWRIAEDAGFDHCWAFDHLATIGPIGDGSDVFDGWTLLGALAAATSRVRMGLLVTGVTYRNPALLAKIATTVDHLSNGRLEFGIGAAWAANEHEMYGIGGLEHRVGVLSESLQAIKSLWTEERTTFDGRYVKFKNAVAEPKPIQKPHPPIWIGAGGPSTLKLTARYADVWNPSGVAGSLEGAGQAFEQLAEACAAIGRDPAEIRRSIQIGLAADAGETLDTLVRFHERGFTELVVMLGATGGGASAVDPVAGAEVVAERLLPEIRKL